MRTAGVEFSGAAENIAYGYPTGTAVLTAWLNSPGHRGNIENCALTEHGVGFEGTHWTHLFITP
ncbi:MAG: CAP domain-containing protein [Gemmatimonadota bacterium]|nr:CAP domain-containing protein [Gemmatimonadota bacterium]MDH3421638.1 CAP domain-containing protein [Gemmatimonadota bacterium]